MSVDTTDSTIQDEAQMTDISDHTTLTIDQFHWKLIVNIRVHISSRIPLYRVNHE
jgi:hypothetical protein